jgi:HEAT repeat protein
MWIMDGKNMPNISEKLLRALESDDACELGHVIKERKQEDFDALLALLSPDPLINPKHRSKALYALGRWGNPTVEVAIHRILPLLNEAERISAIDALGRLGTKEALEDILNYVNDTSPHVRKFVTHALGRINTPEAQSKLKEIAAKDSVNYIRTIAAKYIQSE